MPCEPIDRLAFSRAVPVWQPGREREMNRPLCFHASLPAAKAAALRLAASTVFCVWVDGLPIIRQAYHEKNGCGRRQSVVY